MRIHHRITMLAASGSAWSLPEQMRDLLVDLRIPDQITLYVPNCDFGQVDLATLSVGVSLVVCSYSEQVSAIYQVEADYLLMTHSFAKVMNIGNLSVYLRGERTLRFPSSNDETVRKILLDEWSKSV